MINTSKDILILLHGEELYRAIIASISIARKVIEKSLDVKYVNPDSYTSGSRNPFRKATIHAFFNNYKSIENKNTFNEEWIRNLYSLDKLGVNEDTKLKSLFTNEGKLLKLTNNAKGVLKNDRLLLLHCLWIKKAVLLPDDLAYPAFRNTDGTAFDPCKDINPELMQIFRYQHANNFDNVIGEKTRKNTLWYGFKLLRMTDWYSHSDIKNRDIKPLTEYIYKLNTPYTLRKWLIAIDAFYPDSGIDFDQLSTADYKGTGASGITEKDKDGALNFVFDNTYSEEDKKNIEEWTNNINLYIKKRKLNNIASWKKIRSSISILLGWFSNEIHSNNKLPIPSISSFGRIHLDGSKNFKGLLEYAKNDLKTSSYKVILYRINKFFEYLEGFHKLEFRNPLNIDIDFPLSRRRKSTSKIIFPTDAFSPLLSFSYALAEWAYYQFEKARNNEEIEFHSGTEFVDAQKSGFVPLFWVEGKPFPIHFIPVRLCASALRSFKSRSNNSLVPNLCFLHVLILILESGIRLVHARWIDVRSYRNPVTSDYKPRDYGTNYLHINTDKSNQAWNSLVSNTVIEMMDRHATYRNSFDEECLTKTTWYNNHEGSDFGKVLPLFAIGGIGRGTAVTSSPIGDQNFRKLHKFFIYMFNAHYASVTGESLLNINYDIDEYEMYNIDDLKEINQLYDSEIVKITPHSARSQIVSNLIPILPPSEIKKITGHATEAHCIYYAQLDHTILDRAKQKQVDEIIGELDNPVEIQANDVNSSLRKSFAKNRIQTLNEHGATSFQGHHQDGNPTESGIKLVNTKSNDELYFSTTHICPFNNQCPNEVLTQLETTADSKPCGSCFYSVKTVDHLPAILAKIRALTDEIDELQKYITEAKKSGAARESLTPQAQRIKLLSNEIVSWTITTQMLEKMANDLSSKDTWLVEKPDLLTKQIQKVEANTEFEQLYLKATEAKSYAEFYTPALKHQMTIARTRLLAYTGNFKALLDKTPDDFSLIDEFRGQVKSICNALNINLQQLSSTMEQPLKLSDASESPMAILSNLGGK